MSISDPALPRLGPGNHAVTSPATPAYNCIAWAAGDDTRWWWPASPGGYYWPPNAPKNETPEAFVRAFETLGFEVCADGSVEPGYDKVAIFADLGDVTHAARQLPDGRWTSKLGDSFDIDHDQPDSVGGGLYGEVARFVRRDQRLPQPPGRPPRRNEPCWCASGRKYKVCHGK